MIIDQENIFLDAVEGSKITTAGLTSDVIANVGGGDAANPLFLVVTATEKLAPASATFTAALETSDTEDFKEKTVLGTFDMAADKTGDLVRAKVPYGCKNFLRLVVKGSAAGTGGKLTAALTEDVANW
nr:MAG TPA: major capsid protein [Caudoviricetes sp.]